MTTSQPQETIAQPMLLHCPTCGLVDSWTADEVLAALQNEVVGWGFFDEGDEQ